MDVINWASNFDQACQRAASEGKLILLDFFSPT